MWTKQATEAGTDGQMTYRDQEELRVPVKAAGPPQKKGVEQVPVILYSHASMLNKQLLTVP